MKILLCEKKKNVHESAMTRGQKALGSHQKYLNLCSERLTKVFMSLKHEDEKLMKELSFLGKLTL